ncbi:MAG: NAD(P)H-dependent oxidoreductase [Candidatus Woesearchaeota archaeon]|nr:MAG: NAD(P)H-dependent oxidoreductase [Candidatus Woesearchaeota archaeon]
MEKISVLAFNGSAKKNGNTAKLLKKLTGFIEKDAKVKTIHLVDKKIKPCLSYCAEGGTTCSYPCSIKDDMHGLIELIKKADCVILASPVYWYAMSGLMKNFIDRLTSCDVAEPPVLDGKVFGFVTTAYLDGAAGVTLQMLAPVSSMGAIIAPYNDLFANNGKVWREEFGVKPVKRLAKNLIMLTELVKEKQGRWFYPK